MKKKRKILYCAKILRDSEAFSGIFISPDMTREGEKNKKLREKVKLDKAISG